MSWWKSDRTVSAWSMASPADRQVARDAALAHERSAAALPPDDRAQARKLRSDSLEIWRQVAQVEPTNTEATYGVSRSYHFLAAIERADGKTRQAIRLQRTSLKIVRTLVAADPEDIPRQDTLLYSIMYLAVMLTEAKQGIEAARLFAEASDLTKRIEREAPPPDA